MLRAADSLDFRWRDLYQPVENEALRLAVPQVLMSNASWSPSESLSQLASERAWVLGGILTGVTYGVVLILSFMCLEALISRFRADARSSKQSSYRRNIILICYVIVMFLLGTLDFISVTNSTLLAFVDDRNFPGGPAAFEEQEFSISIDEISNVAPVLASWCGEGMMVSETLLHACSSDEGCMEVMALHTHIQRLRIPFMDHYSGSLCSYMWINWRVSSIFGIYEGSLLSPQSPASFG